MDFPEFGEVLLRMLLAVGGAAVLGWEREKHGKPAGLRTQMLVGLGAAAFTLATLKLFADLNAGGNTQLDPTRVVQGIIGGIGFLGAGTIIEARGSVRGMTTAATIWVVGALGIACGLGYYMLAGCTVGFAWFILVVLGFLEKRLLSPPLGEEDDSETGQDR